MGQQGGHGSMVYRPPLWNLLQDQEHVEDSIGRQAQQNRMGAMGLRGRTGSPEKKEEEAQSGWQSWSDSHDEEKTQWKASKWKNAEWY